MGPVVTKVNMEVLFMLPGVRFGGGNQRRLQKERGNLNGLLKDEYEFRDGKDFR
jgi:hypothetical protein